MQVKDRCKEVRKIQKGKSLCLSRSFLSVYRTHELIVSQQVGNLLRDAASGPRSEQSNSVHFLTPCHLYLAVSFVHFSGLRCVMHFSLLPCVNQQILSEHDLYFTHSYTFRCLQTIRHQAVQKDKAKNTTFISN